MACASAAGTSIIRGILRSHPYHHSCLAPTLSRIVDTGPDKDIARHHRSITSSCSRVVARVADLGQRHLHRPRVAPTATGAVDIGPARDTARHRRSTTSSCRRTAARAAVSAVGPRQVRHRQHRHRHRHRLHQVDASASPPKRTAPPRRTLSSWHLASHRQVIGRASQDR